MGKTVYTSGSFFAGVGGICLGLEQAEHPTAKIKVVWANEIDHPATVTYCENFDHPVIEGDIEKVLSPEFSDNPEFYENLREELLSEPIDILNGGFPCQAFSIAGERRGFEDRRGNLFWSFINFSLLHQEKFGHLPRVIFMENVKNLKSHDKGRTYEVILKAFNDLGYTAKDMVLNTFKHSDLPQNRERIYIVAFRDKQDADRFTLFDELRYSILNGSNVRTEEERVEQVRAILDDEAPEKYLYTPKKYPHYFDLKKLDISKFITEENQFYEIRRGMHVRKNVKGNCPTLMAAMGTGGHNVPLIYTTNQGIRKLTPTEVFKLQGFPIGDGYVLPERLNNRPYPDGQLYKQAGNAVSVPIIKMIAEGILEALES